MKIKNVSLLLILSVVIAFGSFVFGYSLVCISMTADEIKTKFSISQQNFDYHLSFITTMLPLGAFIGSFFIRTFTNKYGQRKTLILFDGLGTLIIGYQCYGNSLMSLYLGRFLLGFYLGVAGGAMPTYLLSISPPQYSGIIGSFNQLLITIGIAVAYGLGMYDMEWTDYMIIPVVFCLTRLIVLLQFQQNIFNVGMIVCRDYFIKKIRNYCQNMQSYFIKTDQYSNCVEQGDLIVYSKSFWGYFTEITSNASVPVIKLGIVLAVANQMSGINAIIFYASQLFQHIGADGEKGKQTAELYSFYMGLLQVVVTLISGWLINRSGRRTLMLIGQSLVVISLFLAYIGQQFINSTFVIVMVFIHIIGFSISLGPISVMYTAQMMQNITLVVTVIWVLTLVVSLTSQILIKSLGIGRVFLFYGVISLCSLIYFYQNMIQTKGKTRNQIKQLFQPRANVKIQNLHVEEQQQKISDYV